MANISKIWSIDINKVGKIFSLNKASIKSFGGGSVPAALGDRGVFGGGYTGIDNSNVLDYITIATVGNAADFGDLTLARWGLAACSSSTRGVFGGGFVGGAINVLDYITISTGPTCTDFGDLTVRSLWLAACSDGHGGL